MLLGGVCLNFTAQSQPKAMTKYHLSPKVHAGQLPLARNCAGQETGDMSLKPEELMVIVGIYHHS